MAESPKMRAVDYTGKVFEKSRDEIEAAYKSGERIGLIGYDGRVMILDQNGKMHAVDSSDPAKIAGYLSEGNHLATQEEVREEYLRQNYGGAGATAKVAAEKFVTGLVPGSQIVFGGLRTGQERQAAAEAAEAHPVAGATSEVLGTAGGLVAGGAVSGAAKGLGKAGGLAGRVAAAGADVAFPQAAFSRAGGAVERAVAGSAAKETGVLAAGQRAAGAAAGASLEGSAYSLMKEVGDAAASDDYDLTAERAVTAALTGGVVSGAAVGGLSLLGSALRGAGRFGKGVVSNAMGRGAGKVDDAVGGPSGLTPHEGLPVSGSIPESIASKTDEAAIAEALTPSGGILGDVRLRFSKAEPEYILKKGRERLRRSIAGEDMADARAWNGLAAKHQEKTMDEVEALMRSTGRPGGLSPEEISNLMSVGIERATARMNQIDDLVVAGEAAAGTRINVGDLRRTVLEKIAPVVKDQSWESAAVSKVNGLFDDITANAKWGGRAERANAILERHLGRKLGGVSPIARPVTPDMGLGDDVLAGIVTSNKLDAKAAGELGALRQEAAELSRSWKNIRLELDRQIKPMGWTNGKPINTPEGTAFRKMYQTVADELRDAASGIDPAFGGLFDEARGVYRGLTILKAGADKQVIKFDRMSQNLGGVGGKAFALLGAVAGGSVGPVTSALGAGAGYAAHAFYRRQGGHMLAFSLIDHGRKGVMMVNNVADIAAVGNVSKLGAKYIVGTVKELPHAVRLMVGTRDTGPAKAETRKEKFKREVERVYSESGNKEQAAHDFLATAQTYAQTMPETAVRMIKNRAMAMDFLKSKVPPTANSASFTPHLVDKLDAVPQYEREKFLRYVRAVDDPLVVFKEFDEDGVPSEETVEVLKNVFPRMYAELRMNIVTEIASLDEPLPRRKEVALAMLFDLDMVPGESPELAARIQKGYAEREKIQPKKGGTSSGSGSSGEKVLAKLERVESERISSKEG